MAWRKELEGYLHDILGQEFAVGSVHEKEMNGLPLYLTKAYTPLELVLFDKKIVLIRKDSEVIKTPGKIAKDVVRFRNQFKTDVAVVLDVCASWERKRLVEKKVPFIVPRRQLYLPMLLLDLREYFPRNITIANDYLSRATQHTVLRQLLQGDVQNKSMVDAAHLLRYSKTTLTKIRGELESLNLCTIENHGRLRRILFPMSAEKLWLRALTNMRSPVFKKHFLTGEVRGLQFAGTSALARKSTLQLDELPTFAIWKKQYGSVMRENHLEDIESEEGAQLIVEEWYYDPRNISHADTVDPLSLYLSLQEDSDERIQIALAEMMETIPWSKG